MNHDWMRILQWSIGTAWPYRTVAKYCRTCNVEEAKTYFNFLCWKENGETSTVHNSQQLDLDTCVLIVFDYTSNVTYWLHDDGHMPRNNVTYWLHDDGHMPCNNVTYWLHDDGHMPCNNVTYWLHDRKIDNLYVYHVYHISRRVELFTYIPVMNALCRISRGMHYDCGRKVLSVQWYAKEHALVEFWKKTHYPGYDSTSVVQCLVLEVWKLGCHRPTWTVCDTYHHRCIVYVMHAMCTVVVLRWTVWTGARVRNVRCTSCNMQGSAGRSGNIACWKS